jgi:hypothetical protein
MCFPFIRNLKKPAATPEKPQRTEIGLCLIHMTLFVLDKYSRRFFQNIIHVLNEDFGKNLSEK